MAVSPFVRIIIATYYPRKFIGLLCNMTGKILGIFMANQSPYYPHDATLFFNH